MTAAPRERDRREWLDLSWKIAVFIGAVGSVGGGAISYDSRTHVESLQQQVILAVRLEEQIAGHIARHPNVQLAADIAELQDLLSDDIADLRVLVGDDIERLHHILDRMEIRVRNIEVTLGRGRGQDP